MNESSNGGDATVSGRQPADDSAGPTKTASCGQPAAQEAMEEIKRRAAEYIDQGKETAAEMAAKLEQQIRQRPVEALVVAAGIGFAVGFLWSRRS